MIKKIKINILYILAKLGIYEKSCYRKKLYKYLIG